MDISFEVNFRVEVISYIPDRPPPNCSNPNKPAYYDAGDPGELTYNIFLLGEVDKNTGKHHETKIDPSELTSEQIEGIEEALLEEIKNQ